MKIAYHGGPTFMHKSHAFLQSNFVLELLNFGHDVTICKPSDPEHYDPMNSKHRILKEICRPDHIYPDYNIWTTSRETEFKFGNHKFDCFLHSDGHYKVRPEEYERFKILPWNYYLRAGLDAAQTIADQFQKPVYGYYDNGVDFEYFNTNVEPFDFYRKDAFIFLLVSQTLYPADIRGLEIALQAFTTTFRNRDDVYFVLKIAEYNMNLHRFVNQHSNIIYIPGLESFDTLARFYKGANCIISPIKGALWESPVLQAMACGTPAIATNAGGPAMYIKNHITGFLLDFEWKHNSEEYTNWKENYFGNIWKEPKLSDLCSMMKFAVGNPQVLKEVGQNAAEDIKNRFGYRNLVSKFVEFLEGSTEFVKTPSRNVKQEKV